MPWSTCLGGPRRYRQDYGRVARRRRCPAAPSRGHGQRFTSPRQSSQDASSRGGCPSRWMSAAPTCRRKTEAGGCRCRVPTGQVPAVRITISRLRSAPLRKWRTFSPYRNQRPMLNRSMSATTESIAYCRSSPRGSFTGMNDVPTRPDFLMRRRSSGGPNTTAGLDIILMPSIIWSMSAFNFLEEITTGIDAGTFTRGSAQACVSTRPTLTRKWGISTSVQSSAN